MSNTYLAFNSNFNAHSIYLAYPVIKETVPVSALGYKTNNKYPEFPPLMSDGRPITASWQPEALINEDLIESNNIKSNWEYRKFLTENSHKIMQYNFREASNDTGYYKRYVDLPSNIQSGDKVTDVKNTPYLFSSVNDNTQPPGYSKSDLKDIYLSREQLDAKKVSPVITQYELLSSA